jgi:hypothetical protein
MAGAVLKLPSGLLTLAPTFSHMITSLSAILGCGKQLHTSHTSAGVIATAVPSPAKTHTKLLERLPFFILKLFIETTYLSYDSMCNTRRAIGWFGRHTHVLKHTAVSTTHNLQVACSVLKQL